MNSIPLLQPTLWTSFRCTDWLFSVLSLVTLYARSPVLCFGCDIEADTRLFSFLHFFNKWISFSARDLISQPSLTDGSFFFLLLFFALACKRSFARGAKAALAPQGYIYTPFFTQLFHLSFAVKVRLDVFLQLLSLFYLRAQYTLTLHLMY
jgi:hypothetical protein